VLRRRRHVSVGQEVRIEGLLQGIGRRARERVRGEAGLDQRLPTAVLVTLLEALAGVAMKARGVLKFLAEAPPVLGDLRQPASRAPAWLIVMFQKVFKDHDEIARDCVLAADGQGFDLVDQVDDVQILEPAFPEEPRLLLDP
jgi:hypothetical protein